MKHSEASAGTMVRTNRHVHGIPPDTFGVICEVSDDHILVAWHLCDKPLPNLTPKSITDLAEDDPRCPLRDRLTMEDAMAFLEPA